MDVVIDRCDNGYVVTFRGERKVYYPNLESVLCAVHDAFDPPRGIPASAVPLRHRPIGEAA